MQKLIDIINKLVDFMIAYLGPILGLGEDKE